MAKGDDIQDRLLRLGVRLMDLCDDLPLTNAGKHIAGQILRSGTSAAPNYAEARGAESPSDFVHKLGVVLKELNETEIWLETLRIRGMLPEERAAAVHQECTELCSIIAVSRRTARERMKGHSGGVQHHEATKCAALPTAGKGGEYASFACQYVKRITTTPRLPQSQGAGQCGNLVFS